MKIIKMSYPQGILVSHNLWKLTIILPHKANKSQFRRAKSALRTIPIILFLDNFLQKYESNKNKVYVNQ